MYDYNLGVRFETAVANHAQRSALWFNSDESISYGGLNKLANKIARWLIAQGVNSRDVVCLSGEKTLSTFACMIGCLKVGAVYCVLDPDSPAERLRKILSTCRPKLLLMEREFPKGACEIVSDLGIEAGEKNSDQLARALGDLDESNLPRTHSVSGASPAYIMFTSGSTGVPKGAVITHAAVLNLIDWSQTVFGIHPGDVLTNVNPLFFDNSVFDFYSALFSGASLAPFTPDEVRDPRRLVDKVDAAGCTLWFSVPSLLMFLQTMKAADGRNLRSIRRFVFGGEGYPKSKLKSLYDSYSDSAEFFNVYGPTECTCICSCYKIGDDDFADLRGLPSLGDIADNFEFLILDDTCKTVPPGETGELCLLGPNVGLGYYNDPQQTAARFVRNPYNDKFAEVMYKTGDLVRLDPADGKLYVQGRTDNQIKHMGYRIELEEIEAALHCLDYVSEGVALHTRENGLSRIIAIVSTREELDRDRMRHDLKQIIPEYMIPSLFYREVQLTKTPNGKIDRRRLAEKYLSQ